MKRKADKLPVKNSKRAKAHEFPTADPVVTLPGPPRLIKAKLVPARKPLADSSNHQTKPGKSTAQVAIKPKVLSSKCLDAQIERVQKLISTREMQLDAEESEGLALDKRLAAVFQEVLEWERKSVAAAGSSRDEEAALAENLRRALQISGREEDRMGMAAEEQNGLIGGNEAAKEEIRCYSDVVISPLMTCVRRSIRRRRTSSRFGKSCWRATRL